MNLSKQQKQMVLVIVAALAVGFFASNMNHKPLNPAERRPVLAAIFRAAKTLLWLAAFAEQPPAEHYKSAKHFHHVDDNGVVMVDHGQGW